MDIALFSTTWWAAFGSIILIDIVLSGDNSVVIAMAARKLPENQRQKIIFWGAGAAIVMRVLLTMLAVQMLQFPYLKIVGGILLLYIGVQLMSANETDAEGGHSDTKTGIWAAVRTILIADVVMSLDNVLAVAAAAKGDWALLIFGLLLSVPLIVLGSTLLVKVMDKFPIIITLGAALLGFLAGEMFVSDPAFKGYFDPDTRPYAGAIGAVFVVAIGIFLAKRSAAK